MTTPLHPVIERETTRRGYLVALALGVAGAGIFALMLWRAAAAIDDMPRIPAKGEHVVQLPAGELVVYGELTSPIGNANLDCGAIDAAGAPLPLTAPSTTTSYDFGDHHGRSLFALDVRTGGPVTFHCETDADVTLAFGSGLGSRIVVGVVVPLLAELAAFVVGLRTFFRRRWEKRVSRR
ncbi:MAG: hypothetical protein JO257_08660 [Deltaproteobacteria bacterium]|nr:hypothetical protein [Deltaproteobacteria bacterium]